jgi:hypothetical protein
LILCDTVVVTCFWWLGCVCLWLRHSAAGQGRDEVGWQAFETIALRGDMIICVRYCGVTPIVDCSSTRLAKPGSTMDAKPSARKRFIK